MLKARQRLGEEVGDVVFASHVHDAKLTLADAVLKPVKPHVDTFRQARGHGFVGEADGTLVVAIDKGGPLGIAEVVQDAAFGVGDANRREETRVLGLLDGRAHHRDEGGVARHRPVNKMQRVGVETWVRCEAEKVERAGDGPSTRPRPRQGRYQ